MFGITEHQIVERRARSVARTGAARRRLPAWLPGPGVVLTGPGAVAWATGGVAPLAGAAGARLASDEIAPGQAESRWHAQRIGECHAVAWNPSLPGGAKAEDTYLVTEGPAAGGGQPDLRRLTDAPGWPETEADSRRPGRPAVLEVGT